VIPIKAAVMHIGAIWRAWLYPFGRAFRLIWQRTYLADPRHRAAWHGGPAHQRSLYLLLFGTPLAGIEVTG